MQLVLVAHGGGASLKVRHVGVVVGHDECALKLPCVAGVDAEVAAQFHGAAHTLGYVDKRAVAEYGAVEGRKEVVAVGHHGAQVLAHQVAMLLHGLADRAEDDALLGQFFLEGGLHRHRVHDGVDGCAAQGKPFLQGYSQLVEGLLHLGVYLPVLGLTRCWVGVVGDGLVVDVGQMQMSPIRSLHLLPVGEGLQSEVEQPLGLSLFLGDEMYYLLIEAFVYDLGVYVGGEAELILLFGHPPDILVR